MKKYKVEITISETYIIDVLASSKIKAEEKSIQKFKELENTGTLHYHSTTGVQMLEVGTVYDVTNTDDLFDGE